MKTNMTVNEERVEATRIVTLSHHCMQVLYPHPGPRIISYRQIDITLFHQNPSYNVDLHRESVD